MNLAAIIGVTAGSINLGAALMHLALARAPGWKLSRIFAAITITAGAYNWSGVVLSSPGFPCPVYLGFVRLAYLFAALHCTAWLLYAFAPPDGSVAAVPPWVRILAGSTAAAATLHALAGFGIGPGISTVDTPWAGVRYHYAQTTLAADLFGILITSLLVLAFVRLVRRFRAGERELGWQLVAFGIFFVCAVDELLVALRVIPFLSLADAGMLAITLPLSVSSIRRLSSEARQLHDLSGFLADQVERTAGERDLAQSALASTERHMNDLVASLDAIVWESDATTMSTRFVSDGARRLLGYSPEEWRDTPGFWTNHIHPGDREAAIADEAEAISTGRPISSEYRMTAADGRIVWLRDVVQPVTGASGKVEHLRGVIVDVTAARFVARALRDSEERFRTLFDAAHDGVALIKDGRIVEVNRKVTELLGQPENELIGTRPSDLGTALYNDMPTPGHAAELAALAQGGAPQNFRLLYQRPGGAALTLEISLSRFLLRDETYLLAAIRDVTAQLTLEAELRQAQKMEAVGLLAGGVAHDFNNLLTVINGYAGILLQDMPPEDPARESVLEIHRAGERAAGLTHQLLTFSRKHVAQMQPMDLNHVIAESGKMLLRMLGEDVILVTNIGHSLGSVKADPMQIQQVLMNLAVNARDAMPHGGTFQIEAANVTLDAAYAATHPNVLPGEYVSLAVSDTGAGMDPQTLSRIFEPFFTTKGLGRGTGLGLSTVYGIVHQHHGSITVTSQLGRGTTFTIYLPHAGEAAPSQENRPTQAAAPANGTGTILLVEDQEAVRTWEAMVLRKLGYEVFEAAGSGDAIRLAEVLRERVDLVVTDVVMPGMNGSDLALHLQPLLPRAGTIYISGYSAEVLSRRGVIDPGITYLSKPFSPELLASKVSEVLARQRS